MAPDSPVWPLPRLLWGSAWRGERERRHAPTARPSILVKPRPASDCWRDPLSRICSGTSSGASACRRLAPGDPPGVADLRTALQDALGPIYRVEREVRPVGACRMFVALEAGSGPPLPGEGVPGGVVVGLGPTLV